MLAVLLEIRPKHEASLGSAHARTGSSVYMLYMGIWEVGKDLTLQSCHGDVTSMEGHSCPASRLVEMLLLLAHGLKVTHDLHGLLILLKVMLLGHYWGKCLATGLTSILSACSCRWINCLLLQR